MSNILSSSHFVGALPQVTSRLSTREVFKTLEKEGKSGVIISDRKHYVKAADLAKSLLENGNDFARMLECPIGDTLDRVQGKSISVPISQISLDELENKSQAQPTQPEAVFEVHNKGSFSGYFLNQETLVATSQGRTVWYCEVDHLNLSPGNGWCHDCPRRIVRSGQITV